MATADEVTIEDLDGATAVSDGDELVIQQDGETKKVELDVLDDFLTYVKKVAQTVTSSADQGINEVTFTMSNGSEVVFHVRNGSRGNSISNVQQTAESTESEGVNTVTVTLTDGETFTFNTRNGKTGNGIQSLTQTKTSTESDGENELTVQMTDGTSAALTFKNGSKGDQGESGVNIAADSMFSLGVDSSTGNVYMYVNDENATEDDLPMEIDEDGNVYYTIDEDSATA